MARPLEYKRRVQLPAELPLRLPAARRSLDVRVWGALLWVGTAALAWSISTHGLRLPGWLHGAAGGADDVTAPGDREPVRDDSAPLQTNPAPAEEVAPGAAALANGARPTAADETGTTADETRTAGAPATEPPAPRPETSRPAAPTAAPLAAAGAEPAVDPASLAPAGPAVAATETPAFVAPPAPEHATTFKSGMSCEDAASTYQEQVQIGGPTGPADLSRGQFASVLENGAWFGWCNVPSSFSVNVCVAVKDGRAVGVTVRTGPRAYKTEACITRAAWKLRFPPSPRLDVTRTVFEAD